LAKTHRLKPDQLLLVGHAEATDPRSGKRIHEFTAVAAADANGPSHRIVVDDEARAVKDGEELDAVFEPSAVAAAASPHHPPPAPHAAITIQPAQNILTLNPTDTFDESLTVTIPKSATTAKADVYLLADTTGSMGSIIAAVKAGAGSILTALNALGVDLAFGLGNYKDFPSDPFAFQHQVSPTAVAGTVMAAINAWSASGGSDGPEGQLFALDSLAVAPGGTIGWRSGSKRIVVWFGDMPGHDPVCTAISGAPAAITEASVTARLVAEKIAILAISTANPGLDGNPTAGATDYTATCGAPGGTAGQASRLATATGGTAVTGINPANIVNTIIGLVTTAVSLITNVRLAPSASIAPFVSSINPSAGYGPLPGDKAHVLTFRVKFSGIPCREEAQVVNGTLDVVADGVVVAAKRVQITVPPCRAAEFVYSVKYICGTQAECACACAPLRPGHYATEINIHNHSGREVRIRKRVIPVVFAGAVVGREPAAGTPKAADAITLPPHSATMDDCCRLTELLLRAPQGAPLNVGFLEITASAEVAVTAVYTSSGPRGGLAIDVQQIEGRKQ
jgi:hypothetical protein